jgi:MATE family multidrug resistance protein
VASAVRDGGEDTPVKSRFGATDREILGLAIPALGALAIDPLLTLADTAFVARLGTVPLAALGVDTAILGFAFFAFNFLAYVVTPLVARALGAGRIEEARRWVGDALLLAVALGVVVSIVVELSAPLLVDLMGAGPEVADPAISYLRIRALATPAVLVVTAGHGAFRGHKDTRTPLKVALGVNLINLVLDPILIFSAGWGLEGAAVATVVAQ